jgi:hypothetical protein
VTAYSPAWRRPARWLPSVPMISAKLLEIRKRRILISVIVLFTVGLPVVIFGFRLAFHLADPKPTDQRVALRCSRASATS